MDFTPPSNSDPPPIHANPISSIPSSRKLPIKRKNPDSNSALILTIPNSTSPDPHDRNNPPPFKFHRVWSEPDEIRLLHGLLDCSSQGLSFPKDLPIFYAHFSNGMSQPYSKSQLSEKLRRLRKKFRVMTSRLEKGLDKALLSPQDRALYDLSKQLWGPNARADHPSLSVADKNVNCKSSNRASNMAGSGEGVEVPLSKTAVLALPTVVKKPDNRDNAVDKLNTADGGLKDDDNGIDANGVELEGGVKLGEKEVRVGRFGDDLSSGIVRFVTTTLADVVDQSLKEMKVRMMLEVRRFSDVEKEVSFEKRWRDQRAAEFDVLAKRLKLIVECSSMVGK